MATKLSAESLLRHLQTLASFSLAAAVAGCAGAAGTSSGGVAPVLPQAVMPSAVIDGSRKTAKVTFRIRWAKRHHPPRAHYLPATALSIGVSVNGSVQQVINTPTAKMVIDAPVGTDTFSIASYDARNGQGNELSRALVTQKIRLSAANVVAAALDGVAVSMTLTLSNPAPNAGARTTVNVLVAALDADGNTIVGGDSYASPIRLHISDPSNSRTLTLSKTVLSAPSSAATLTYTGGTLGSAGVVATATGIAPASASFAPAPTFYVFAIAGSARPLFIAAGSDGNLWFTEAPGASVGRITNTGVVTQFPVPSAPASLGQIIAASDGNLWLAEQTPNKIAKLTTAGAYTEFSTLFAPPPNDNPLGLVDRGDGTIWYAANGSARVGFQGISSGAAGETSVPTANSGPYGIATAPDNNLYYTESAVDKIGRVTNLFTAQSEILLTAGSVPESIVRGPDGNLWFAENGTSKIGRLEPFSFSVTGEFPTVTPNAAPVGIVVAHDGAMWFTENGLDRVGRITTDGSVTEYAAPVTGLALSGIATARNGTLWMCAPGSGLNPPRILELVY